MPLQPPSRSVLTWAAVAVGGLAIATSLPKAADNLKPTAKQNTRMAEQMNVLTDKKTGNIYGWIDGKNGEKRFVKMDKNSENKVRKEREDAKKLAKAPKRKEPTVIYVSKKENDVRSEKIFSRDSTYKQFAVNARIKYRLREQKMLYRLAISLAPSEDSQCLTKIQEGTLLNLTKERDNKVRFRFVDADDFWLRDNLMPLNEGAANNYKTTVIDSYHKDSCGFVNKLVFHGRLDKFSLPDYSWVEDGKLLFSGVKIVEGKPEIEDNK